jgi:hypothetical protein
VGGISVMAPVDTAVPGPIPRFLFSSNGSIEPYRSLVMIGVDDEVAPEHAIAMHRGLPDAELALVPWTVRPPLRKAAACNKILFTDTFVQARPQAQSTAVA